jgi:hypothetical protein
MMDKSRREFIEQGKQAKAMRSLFQGAAAQDEAEQLRAQLRRASNRIETLERRNQSLRDEVERITHGELPQWTPFEEASYSYFGDGTRLADPSHPVFVNSRYQVTIFTDGPVGPEFDSFAPGARLIWLSIKRQDGAAIADWRDLQRIKNEIVGPEAEGVMLYPAESRCVDGANQFHLICLDGGKWPIGFQSRLVSEQNSDGVQQRPWPDDQRPKDLQNITMAQMRAAYESGE